MVIKTILLLLQVETAQLCESLIIPNESCYETVLECAYDEGDANWCFQAYMLGELEDE